MGIVSEQRLKHQNKHADLWQNDFIPKKSKGGGGADFEEHFVVSHNANFACGKWTKQVWPHRTACMGRGRVQLSGSIVMAEPLCPGLTPYLTHSRHSRTLVE